MPHVLTVKIKTGKLKDINPSDVYAQEGLAAALPISNLNLSKPVYFANFTKLIFALSTCSFTVAKKVCYQCCKYSLLFFKCMLKFTLQCLLVLFVYIALALYIISHAEKL